MDLATMDIICERFAVFVQSAQVDRLTFVFHGGEPMMAKIENLEKFIGLARSKLGTHTDLNFAMQTNGTIIKKEWLEFFERTGLAVGISIDGPPEYNDIHRRTKQDTPTHELVTQFVKQCATLADEGRMKRLGTITVINNKFDVKKIVAHLQDDFNFASMSFIMPDDAANDILFDSRKAEQYGQALIDIYNENVQDRRIRNKEVLKFMSRLQPGEKEPAPVEGVVEYIGVTVQSNAVMKINEELIATGRWRKEFPVLNLATDDILPYVETAPFSEYIRTYNRIPDKCMDCTWKHVCRGGSMQERKNPANGFNERSVFCKSYQQLYEYMYADLVGNGYPEPLLREKLSLN
jgi:uncharacterized protein